MANIPQNGARGGAGIRDAFDRSNYVSSAPQAGYAPAQGGYAPAQGQGFYPGPLRKDKILTVFEGDRPVLQVNLDQLGKPRLSFGCEIGNDIVITSQQGIVSRHHGFLTLTPEGWAIEDAGSTNGLLINGTPQQSALVGPSDIITIGKRGMDVYDAISLTLHDEDTKWIAKSLRNTDQVRIGRAGDNDIVLASPAVSSHHVTISRAGEGSTATWNITDNNSFNGTFLNGVALDPGQPRQLQNGDVVHIANAVLTFEGNRLLYMAQCNGVELVAHDLVQIRKTKGQERITNDHISLHIGKGELVAIVGGSGSGKTTLLNELNGSEPAVQGSVYLDGIELYPNYGQMKNSIGYVPQQDIVYDDLRLLEMLKYAAELRMPPDTTKAEREQRCYEVMEMLELTPFKDNFIGRLSGGQKKRASIAVELLADPRLLFLDEPTSGLDPGIEQNLMRKLSEMAHEGRTIILVTHTTLNLHLCDQVVFLAPGGKLCFAGNPDRALQFFGISDFAEVYNMVAQAPDAWQRSFAESPHHKRTAITVNPQKAAIGRKKNPSFISQLSTLSRRYTKLIVNDKPRLALLILQAPVLAALICLVAGNDCFQVYEDTKSCLFALSCAAFWVGMLDSIQEICKERVILKREYAGGLNMIAYVLSKVLVLGVMCVLQSLLLAGVFCVFQDMPEEALVNVPLEIFITVFLTTMSAMCLGLAVSALFRNPDRAIAVAPILIMPQILFSGLIFKLEGFAENISLFVNCRWGMEAFGTTANLNALDLAIYESDFIDSGIYEHEWEEAFDYAMAHLTFDWGVLGLFCIVCLGLCIGALLLSIRKPN